VGDGGPPQCRFGVTAAFAQDGGQGGLGQDAFDGGGQG